VAASGGDEAEDRVERRLVQLLNARRNALDAHMRSIAALLHAAGIGIDPDRLARDLSHWDAPDRRVQSRWARDFWRAPYPNESEEVA
jgi:CRISPR type I-E-associated protein CasB/Cse2